ncbi:retrovirus-related pol polyprotein from transposon TNT 1-94 [Tanacetum coccineum]
MELGAYDISYIPRSAIKGQVLTEFLGNTITKVGPVREEALDKEDIPESSVAREAPTQEDLAPGPNIWPLYTDGASNDNGPSARLILIDPEGAEYYYALRLNLSNSNNDTDYEALLTRLRITTKIKVKDIHAFVDSKLVASQVKGSYQAKDEYMKKYKEKVLEADVDMSEESNSEPAKKRTSSRRVIKKKVIITADDNINPEPDVALALRKSISLTEAAKEEAAWQVYATHARIVIEYVPKPARKRLSCIAFRDTSSVSKKMSFDLSQKLKGVQTLTLEEKITADTMKALKESKKTSRRQPGTRGSSEGTGVSTGVPDEDKVTSKENVILE